MGPRIALGATLVVVIIALGVVLTASKPRQAGSNYVKENAQAHILKGDQRYCQSGELIPGDTGALRLLVATFHRPTPDLVVTVKADGREVTSGRLSGGRREGHQEIPLRTVDDAVGDATVCVRPEGTLGRTVLYGDGEAVRFEWLRPGSESWLSIVPAIAHRISLGKANPFGGLLLPFLVLVVIAAWALACRVLLREVAR